MYNSSDTLLTKKELLFVLKSFAVSVRPAAIFIYYVIQNIPSDAESPEEQDDSKHKFVGGTTAKLWSDFHKGVVINTGDKHGREMKMKDLNFAEEGDFPCKLR